jgi:glutamine phosphoribosylpyrophosphate amidotransferase
MCAVVGAILKDPRKEDFQMLHRVFLESKIRGMHATGISYVKNGEIVTDKRPVPADQFPFKFEDYVNEDGNLYLVGHCRYSTSDLEYNQPIANKDISVVHNGVITQELPEHWVEKYGYTCETKNDTELILKTLEANASPLEHWKDASLAVCELYADKKLRVYRNGQRPLYLTSVPSGCIITSTWNIPERANVGGSPVNLLMNHYTTFDENLAMTIERVDIAGAKDLQNYELR